MHLMSAKRGLSTKRFAIELVSDGGIVIGDSNRREEG